MCCHTGRCTVGSAEALTSLSPTGLPTTREGALRGPRQCRRGLRATSSKQELFPPRRKPGGFPSAFPRRPHLLAWAVSSAVGPGESWLKDHWWPPLGSTNLREGPGREALEQGEPQLPRSASEVLVAGTLSPLAERPGPVGHRPGAAGPGSSLGEAREAVRGLVRSCPEAPTQCAAPSPGRAAAARSAVRPAMPAPEFHIPPSPPCAALQMQANDTEVFPATRKIFTANLRLVAVFK